ncbi:hypothetical protein ACLOJK_037230 [Asimina triloba]
MATWHEDCIDFKTFLSESHLEMGPNRSASSNKASSAPEGSWTCNKCGNLNYPFRTVCNRKGCGSEKPDAACYEGWQYYEAMMWGDVWGSMKLIMDAKATVQNVHGPKSNCQVIATNESNRIAVVGGASNPNWE